MSLNTSYIWTFCVRSADREDFWNAPVKVNETPKEDDTDTEIANDFIFLLLLQA